MYTEQYGWPSSWYDVVHPGKTFIYEFDILDRASPFWFHPHPDLRTASSLLWFSRLCLISDDIEAQAGLDTGEYDLPLVIQDRTFDANNQLYISPGYGMMGGGMMGMMQGFLGNRIWLMGNRIMSKVWHRALTVCDYIMAPMPAHIA